MLLLASCFICGNAFAHIKNEASQFPDIEFSESRFDIVVLVGAGIIPETPVFEPDKPLSKRELVTWAALAVNLAAGGETPDTDALADAALEQGLVDSLEGTASYADLNDLFFAGRLSVDTATATPTKAQAASFIASQLHTDAGQALLETRGLRFGDVGQITAVELGQEHHGDSTYLISVGNTALPMYSHGRVANGPTDLVQWQGRVIRRSFVRGQGDAMMWAYLEAEPLKEAVTFGAVATETAPATVQPDADRKLMYGLMAAVLVLGLALFFRGQRVS